MSSIASTAREDAFKRNLDQQYKKAKFKLGSKIFEAYIADTEERRSEGLMFITSLPRDTGMLFVFEEEQPLGFWMKNTRIPLSIGFFDAKGELREVIREMKPASSILAVDIPSYQSRDPGVFALEMNKDWFKKNGIQTGVKLKLISPADSPLLQKKLPRSK
ncbi:MAG: DUF192 domain-containing protein [Bdellovibrionales bacterium]